VRDVLADDGHRRALAREGRRQALRFDFVGRSPEVAQLLTEATGVSFVAAVPPLEEDVASGSSPPVAAPAALAVRPPPANVVVAVPPAAVAAEYSEGAAAMPVRRPPTRPSSSPSHVRSMSLSVPEADDDVDGAVVDTWSGETVLDDGRGAAIAEAERVKAALLHTASGERERSSPPTAEGSTSGARPMRSQGPRSVSLVIDALDGEDDWSRDTIADGSPIEPSAPPPTRERIAEAAPLPRAMVLEVVNEMTAEDDDG
jgi:hypothetical protein